MSLVKSWYDSSCSDSVLKDLSRLPDFVLSIACKSAISYVLPFVYSLYKLSTAATVLYGTVLWLSS